MWFTSIDFLRRDSKEEMLEQCMYTRGQIDGQTDTTKQNCLG